MLLQSFLPTKLLNLELKVRYLPYKRLILGITYFCIRILILEWKHYFNIDSIFVFSNISFMLESSVSSIGDTNTKLILELKIFLIQSQCFFCIIFVLFLGKKNNVQLFQNYMLVLCSRLTLV